MGEESKIQWTDDTWNGWRGCTKISPGCANCYAETLVMRWMKGGAYRQGVPRVRHAAATFDAPLRWNKKPWVCDTCGRAAKDKSWCDECGEHATYHRRRVFSLSLGDWLDAEVPLEWLADMLSVIERCPDLDFLLLTKRPENTLTRIGEATGWPVNNLRMPVNVWFGFSAENQEQFDARWEHARNIPTRQLFVSFEPLLGPIVLPEDFFDAGDGIVPWGIIGGESGLLSRMCRVEWIENLHAQFTRHECPVFVKQMGGNVWSDTDDFHCPMSDLGERGVQWKAHLKDQHGGDPAEWPKRLRTREWPAEYKTLNLEP